jgi:hypothetical protein
MRVIICDPKHPHYPETGTLTGKIISLLGTPMAEMKLDSCRHGTDGCFVKKGQVKGLRPSSPEALP